MVGGLGTARFFLCRRRSGALAFDCLRLELRLLLPSLFGTRCSLSQIHYSNHDQRICCPQACPDCHYGRCSVRRLDCFFFVCDGRKIMKATIGERASNAMWYQPSIARPHNFSLVKSNGLDRLVHDVMPIKIAVVVWEEVYMLYIPRHLCAVLCKDISLTKLLFFVTLSDKLNRMT